MQSLWQRLTAKSHWHEVWPMDVRLDISPMSRFFPSFNFHSYAARCVPEIIIIAAKRSVETAQSTKKNMNRQQTGTRLLFTINKSANRRQQSVNLFFCLFYFFRWSGRFLCGIEQCDRMMERLSLCIYTTSKWLHKMVCGADGAKWPCSFFFILSMNDWAAERQPIGLSLSRLRILFSLFITSEHPTHAQRHI